MKKLLIVLSVLLFSNICKAEGTFLIGMMLGSALSSSSNSTILNMDNNFIAIKVSHYYNCNDEDSYKWVILNIGTITKMVTSKYGRIVLKTHEVSYCVNILMKDVIYSIKNNNKKGSYNKAGK